MASSVHQEYDLPDGAHLTIDWAAGRPATQTELDLLARLAQVIERHQAARAGEGGGRPSRIGQ